MKALVSPLMKSLLASLAAGSTFSACWPPNTSSSTLPPLAVLPFWPLVLASVKDFGNGIGILSACFGGLLGLAGGGVGFGGATTGAGTGSGLGFGAGSSFGGAGAVAGTGTGVGLATAGAGFGGSGLGAGGTTAGFGAGAGAGAGADSLAGAGFAGLLSSAGAAGLLELNNQAKRLLQMKRGNGNKTKNE